MAVLALLLGSALCGKYNSFKVAIYTRAQDVVKLGNQSYLDETWKLISDQLTIDKIYLETHRDRVIVEDDVIERVKRFFTDKGIEVAGGITFTINESNNFETFCFSNPEHRQAAKELAELTARHYDSFILDDFFFTSCKSDIEIAAKGSKTWTEYRQALLAEAGRNLVHGPAHSVKPNVKVIIKYPNWYEHFPGLGFDLSQGPSIFDGIWTGTETRDPSFAQHLQNYLGYEIIRYFNNIAPGRNGGGWVDTYGSEIGADRYAEQLWLTLFGKTPEISLFAYHELIGRPIIDWIYRKPWQGTVYEGQSPSFNYSDATRPRQNENGELITPSTFAAIAGWTLKKIDDLVGKLGNPRGILSYKPYNSLGDDFLPNYLGMIGLPIEMVPEYPTSAKVVLLTAQAAKDPEIISKIKATLKAGGDVFITSGLVSALPAINDIVEIEARKSILINNYSGDRDRNATSKGILVKQLWFQTNDAWEIVSGGSPLITGTFGVPLVLRALYSNGNLWVLTIPEDFGNLYDYSVTILNTFRRLTSTELGVYLEGPAKVSLFLYDNGYLIVENFNDIGVNVTLRFAATSDLVEDNEAATSFLRVRDVELPLAPHQYRAFKATPLPRE
jgi:hypothetical protein